MSSSQVTWSSGRQVIMASSHPVILSSCYLVFLLHVIWSSGHLVIQSSCHPVILCHLVIFVSTLLLTDRHTTSGSTGLLWRQLLIMTSSSTNTSILYFVDPCSLQRGRPCQLGAEEKIRLAGSPWQDCLHKVDTFKNSSKVDIWLNILPGRELWTGSWRTRRSPSLSPARSGRWWRCRPWRSRYRPTWVGSRAWSWPGRGRCGATSRGLGSSERRKTTSPASVLCLCHHFIMH